MNKIGDKILHLIQGEGEGVSFRLKAIRLVGFILPIIYIALFTTRSIIYGQDLVEPVFGLITVSSLIIAYLFNRFFLNHKQATILGVLVLSVLIDISFLFFPSSNGTQLIIYIILASLFYLLGHSQLTMFVDIVTFLNFAFIIFLTIIHGDNAHLFIEGIGNNYYSLSIGVSLIVLFVFIRYYFSFLQRGVNDIKLFNVELKKSKKSLEKKNEELIKLNKELNREKIKNIEELKLRNNFLSIMSHEIRTPLNAIVGFSDFIKDINTSKEDIHDSVKNIHFSSQHLLLLVNDILDYNKLGEGKLELINKSFNFRRSLELVHNLYQKTAQEKNLDLIFEIDDNLKYDNYIGDKTRINQVIINLLTNAIKFTEKGSVKFICKIESIEENIVKFHISVVDTGIGIEDKDKQGVFERFTQIDKGVSRKYQGSGLGLSISKSIVSLFGSEIKVESEVGKGSSFSFSLSLEKDLDQELDLSKEKFIRALESIRVLVADDNILNRKMILKVMSKWGVESIEVDDGDKAVEFLEKNDCDIVLMDIHMPKLDGFEATKQIRNINRKNISSIPIIALTADVVDDTVEKIKNSSMNDYLSKPFDTEQLKRKLIKFVLLNFQKKQE